MLNLPTPSEATDHMHSHYSWFAPEAAPRDATHIRL
jgi:hypothetical protein